MSVAQETLDFRENLAYLQIESLKVIAACAALICYVWFALLIWPVSGGAASPSAWVGVGLLGLGATIGYVLKERRLHVAALALVWGILGAAACAFDAVPSPAIVYLLILPIIFASVLLSQRAFLLVAATASLLVLAIGLAHMETLSLAGDVAFPVLIISLVSAASWLSVRNLHTALAWVWNGYAQARDNEQVARERQAELRRALKALDEATHRLERTNYMLTLARDQAEEARRLKQRFAQTISHELRTPLNLVVGFTELMAESPEYYGGSLSPAYLRDLNIVHRNACHLQTLVNDVLDLARIEAAQMSLLPEETDVVALVQEAVHTARSLVEARGLTLRTEVETGLPRLWIDPTRIRQVLFNLLNNAARFTECGGVTVGVRGHGEEVIFVVTDTGVGIAPEDVPRIFQEFHQADGSMRRQHGGAGLGLAISKQFVELHGGRIWVESQVGQGSAFYFSLPTNQSGLDVALGNRPSTATRPLSAKGSEEPVLLVVTGSSGAAALLTRYVHHFQTVVVPDLQQAQKVAQQLMPQAVVIDQASARVDPAGLEALALEWGLPRAWFIVCPLPGEELLRQQLAVDGYLVKPVSRHILWDMLRQFGERVDKVLVVDDDRDFVLLLGRMLEDSAVRRYQVIGAHSGQEGLAMMRYHQPDLVLLDLGLPDLDGLQVIERIRSNPRWQRTPIVVISGQDRVGSQEALMGVVMVARADGWMPGEVVRWIQNLVGPAGEEWPAPAGGNGREAGHSAAT
jgi:signal transduction histidine kinase/CheY-like chemotaxis protein